MNKLFNRLLGHRIRCDDCGKTFRPNLADQPRPDGGLDRRFLCPHCGKQTVVARITSRGREYMRELQDVQIGAPDAKVTIERLRKLIKREVTRGS